MTKIFYFCKECNIALKGLRYIMKNKKYEVVGCFISKSDKINKIENFCAKHNIPIYFNIDKLLGIYHKKEIDLFISFTNTTILNNSVLKISKKAINFHPAILPNFKGVSTSCHAIIEGLKIWGATAHYMDSGIDTGNIIKIEKFSLDKLPIQTGYELSHYTWKIAFKLLKNIIKKFNIRKDFKSYKNNGGKYYSQKLLNDLKQINILENSDILRKRIMGLWYPPFECSYIKVQNEKFYLITQEILNEISNLYELRDANNKI